MYVELCFILPNSMFDKSDVPLAFPVTNCQLAFHILFAKESPVCVNISHKIYHPTSPTT